MTPCESLAVTWAGHSTALVELDGVRVLTDPVLRDRAGPLRRIGPPVGSQIAERIDAVLLSHLQEGAPNEQQADVGERIGR